MVNITRPTVYYIQHPLSDPTLSEQALASFSDEDIAEYKSEHQEYLTAQFQAVKDMRVLCDEAMEYVRAIFGKEHSGKQVRYFERNINNGETFVDKHSVKYAAPETVESRIVKARQKYCALLGEQNVPTIGGSETLQEINNAVAFLLGKGLSLNVDFTVSNALTVAKTIASQDFDDSVAASDDGTTIAQYNVVMKNGSPFPATSFKIEVSGRNRFSMESLVLNKDDDDWNDEIRSMLNGGFSYSISFAASEEPVFTIC